jgi:hypothetical protein
MSRVDIDKDRRAPTALTASAVAIKVCATVITSSPRPTPRARSTVERRRTAATPAQWGRRTGGKGLLEGFHLRSQMMPAESYRLHGTIDGRLNGGVLRLEIDKGMLVFGHDVLSKRDYTPAQAGDGALSFAPFRLPRCHRPGCA